MIERDCVLLPNLGAEEGDDWRAYQREPTTRVAARLWACLFSATARLRTPPPQNSGAEQSSRELPLADLWPSALGALPTQPAYPWLDSANSAVPWLRTRGLEDSPEASSGLHLTGASAEIVSRVHDKAFAVETSLKLDLTPRSLAPLLSVLSPADLADPETAIELLSSQLARWPEWTGRRFTLKPRFGSSGRGRVGGTREIDTPALRGALPRLAARGGAIFEPWLDRKIDLSVCLHIDATADLPTVLGSAEMIATASGVYRGHCGEIDHRGRVFSGHDQDEVLRAHAAAFACEASKAGYYGPCGLDSFVYREPASEDRKSGDRERLRPVVEFNARPTMGLVTLGLLRRALPLYRSQIGIEPGIRRGFLFAMLGEDATRAAEEIARRAKCPVPPLDLSHLIDDGAPRPFVFFSQELAPLREAYREVSGC